MEKSNTNGKEEWAPGPSKQKENRSAEKWIVHCSHSNENLIRLQSYKSWKVLLDAAKIRKHQAFLEKASTVLENEVPDILHHRRCRSIFTLKDMLKRIQEQEKACCTSLS